MPFKEGYSILILPYPTRFSTLFSSLRFNPPVQPTIRSFVSRLGPFVAESHNGGRKSSLWFLARHIRLHARLARSLFSFMWESPRRFSRISREAVESKRFSPFMRETGEIFWLFGYSRRLPHNGLSCVPSRVSRTTKRITRRVKSATESYV